MQFRKVGARPVYEWTVVVWMGKVGTSDTMLFSYETREEAMEELEGWKDGPTYAILIRTRLV